MKNLTSEKRMYLMMGGIGAWFITMIWFFVAGNNRVKSQSIGKAGDLMLQGQKEKIKVATHSTAVYLGIREKASI